MDVSQVLTQAEAEAELGSGIWEAEGHVLGDGTSVDYDRTLSRDTLSRLRFTSDRAGASEVKRLDIDPETELPRGMALTTARWLTEESAALLDNVLDDEPATPAARTPEVIVEQALSGMPWNESIGFFGGFASTAESSAPRAHMTGSSHFR
jgi:hypothetical protein